MTTTATVNLPPESKALAFLLTIGETAAFAQVHRRTVDRWLEEGLPSVRAGGRVLIRRADLVNWLRATR